VTAPAAAAPPVIRPLLRGWLHVGGVITLLACCPLLYARTVTSAQVAWVTCYVVGVGTMMATSATLHRGRWSPPARRRMGRADLSAIYLAITGSYLAIAGLTMHGDVRLALIAGTSTFAVGGIATTASLSVQRLTAGVPKWVTTAPYLVVGWAAVAVMPEIYRGGGAACFALIVAGGVAYSVGALIYALRRPALSPRVFGFHELFHACTLVGAGCHFAAIFCALR
jgi:hemolysin III